jgi:penicillin-binding protein 1A
MTNLLKGVVKYGTGRRTSGISNFIGGKTGTTNSYVDAWFVGFSHNLATAVWTGFDNNNTLGWGETGAKTSLPVWRTFMKAGIEKYGEHDFFTPKGIINVKIDKKTGKLYRGGSDKLFVESFVEGTEPGAEKPESEGGLIPTKEEPDSILSEDDYYNFQ